MVHNGYYFHKDDNRIEDTDRAIAALHELSARLLRSRRPKNWFRAWFNMGLANRLEGGARPLPCRSAGDVFFVDPSASCGRATSWRRVSAHSRRTPSTSSGRSEAASRVRERVRTCDEECWMIGTVSPAMKRNKLVPARWVARAKLTGTLPPVGDGAGPGRPGAA